MGHQASSGATSSKVRVVYIMGDGRSGTTILDIILGNHPLIHSCGELWKWPYHNGHPRPDNTKQGDHEFWQQVRACYFGEEGPEDLAYLCRLQNSFEDYKRFPLVAIQLIPRERVIQYHQHIRKLLKAIASSSGANVLVDSSKLMGRALQLSRDREVDLYVVHLVRDPRGSLYSHTKRDVDHKTKDVFSALAHYWVKGVFSSAVRVLIPRHRYQRLRYEDLANSPTDTLRALGEFVGVPMETVIKMVEDGDAFRVGTLIDGNRLRKQEAVQLRFDAEWKRSLGRAAKCFALIATFPFSMIYGYHRREHQNS